MRALTMDEVGFVSGGNVEGPEVVTGPGGVVFQRNFDGNPSPTAMDIDLAGGCPILNTCTAILRPDGSDTGYVKSEQDGKTYLGNKLATDVINQFEINWTKVAADLAVIATSAIGGVGGGVGAAIAGVGGAAAQLGQYLAGQGPRPNG
jgi:hypothetical protein